MSNRQAGLYARVSSEKQAEAKTIDSQVEELRERVRSAPCAPGREA